MQLLLRMPRLLRNRPLRLLGKLQARRVAKLQRRAVARPGGKVKASEEAAAAWAAEWGRGEV